MQFLMNPFRLSFMVPDLLGGLLLAGSRGEAHDAGSGDCIMLDGASGFLAIADGTERTPEASRRFLRRTARYLRQPDISPDDDRLGVLREAAKTVLGEFSYEDRTTYVCLLPGPGGSVFFVSGGDSLLLLIRSDGTGVSQRNRSNMGFAGRSREVPDWGRLEVASGDLLLLATDGLWDLARGDREDLLRALSERLRSDPIHLVMEHMVRDFHPAFSGDGRAPHDDLCAVLFDPSLLGRPGPRVLVGGTDVHAQVAYQRRRHEGAFPDRYLPLPHASSWIFPEDLPQIPMDGSVG